MKHHRIGFGLGLLGFGLAFAASIGQWAPRLEAQPIPVPQVQTIGPTDLFQDIVGGQPSAQSFYVPAPLLGNFGATQPGNNAENWLIGGDATTNLFQRGTTGASVTTTLTYGGPDRWAYWSGTGTAMTVSQDTTAADLRPGYKAAFKMARTSGQTGVVQMCMMQVVESLNSYAFQGGTAEVDFDAVTGANFSAASGNMTVVYITGTGVDGSASTAAFNYNAGGGGSSTWTGQVNTAVVVSLGGAGTTGRYGAVFPTTATTAQVAVALCYTPVGTAGTNDYIAFGNIQLTRNSAFTTLAGTGGAAVPPNDPRLKAFSRRSAEIEAALQYRYYYRINEGGTAGLIQGTGYYDTTTHCSINFTFPAPMRTTPTLDETTSSITTSTWKIAPTSVTPVVLAGTGSSGAILQVGSTAAAPFTMGSVSFITTTETQWISCGLDAAAGGGWFGFIAEY